MVDFRAGQPIVPATDSTGNALVSDVIGSKSDATQQTIGTTRSLMSYLKGAVDALVGAGVVSYPAAADPANAANMAAVMRRIWNNGERMNAKLATTLSNGLVLFTIGTGSIQILELILYCKTANDGTATTVQFNSTPTLGSAKTISAASASLASAAAGACLILNHTSLATAPDLITAANGGVAIGANVANRMIVHPGTINLIVGVGSTTGTWDALIRWKPLAQGATVS